MHRTRCNPVRCSQHDILIASMTEGGTIAHLNGLRSRRDIRSTAYVGARRSFAART